MSRQLRQIPPRGFALIYGEDRYDTAAIKELLLAVSPSLTGRIRALRQPPIEIKNAVLADLPHRAERLSAAVAVEQARRDIRCVFAHEDCDAVEPAHRTLTRKIEDALVDLGCPAYAVCPAWEMEAWWFLWPDAVKATNPSWRAPDDYLGRQVGRVRDAREKLKRAVVPKGLNRRQKQAFRTYAASDAPRIARTVRERGEAENPGAQSESYAFFVDRAKRCVND